MKIMIIGNDTTYVYNLRDQIIQRLVEDGHTIIIVSELKSFQEELIQMGCELIHVHIGRHGKNPLNDLKLYSDLKKIIHEEEPDLVLTFNIKPNVYGGLACRKLHKRTIPNITGLGTAVEYPGILQLLSIFLYRQGLKNAALVFFQNEENKSFFLSRKVIKPNQRYYVLPGSGVNLQRHQPIDYPKEKESISFLFIARIMKEKGIDLYIHAAKRIKEKYPHCCFHICGGCDDPNYKAILKEEDGKAILYHGEQKDMIPYYKAAHCIVHPSYYPEGMSNVLLEAAAHCRPIITTDRAGCREIVTDKVNGFVISIRNEEALIDAIEAFLQLSWEEKKMMGVNGRKIIEEKFDRKIVADIYSKEVKRICVEIEENEQIC